MNERWLPVVGSDGFYEVSDQGNVRSYHKRGCTTCRAPMPAPLKQRADKDNHGRRVVNMRMASGKMRTVRVHRLVLSAFVGPCPPGLEVCHNDGDAANNSLENLRYDTRKSNLDDRLKHRTVPRGEAHSHHSLTEADILEIRALAAAGVSQTQIGAKFGIHQASVSKIHLRKTWTWLP